MAKDQVKNGPTFPSIPNGSTRQTGDGSRSIHDGFATIRSSGIKRRTARSVPLATPQQKTKPCSGCCVPTMEPLWEEKNGKISDEQPVVVRRDPKVPWWEVATRRSRYRSCPAFSQASIVTALEQTVTDVTDRLERLASSPDLKAAEVEELRKSAAVLRRQSSAVSQSVSSGYFSLERQPSCDSVSSVSSSMSNATHISYNSMASRQTNHICSTEHKLDTPDQSKQKKRNWLRASFRRAFGKQNRKRTKTDESTDLSPPQTMTRSAPNRYFSCTSLNRKTPHHETNENRIFIPNRKDPDMVQRLQQVLIEKERLLADTRVELMNSQAQVQKHADTINKLQVETITLKEENQRLTNIVQTKYGNIGETQAPLVQSFNSLTMNNSAGQYATLRSIQGSKMKIFVHDNVRLLSPVDVTKCDKNSSNILIGSVSILPKTTWEELDNLVAEKFEDYCNRYDPGAGLGLSRESLYCYQLAEALRSEISPKPDLLPYGYCVGEVDAVHLWLRGPLQKTVSAKWGSLDSICFQGGVAHSIMKSFMGLLDETKRVVLVGPPSTGKSTLALHMARTYAASVGATNFNKSVVNFRCNGNNNLELCQKLTSTWPRIKNSYGQRPEDVPVVLVIDNLHATAGVIETLQRCLPSSQTRPVVIGTCENSPSLVTRLQVHCSFRWVGLSLQEEPVKGLLGRILRRPLLEAEETTGVNLPCVHKTIDWVTRLWIHLNAILSQAGLQQTIGPTLFSECPIDQEKARLWFTNKWNDVIAPLITDMTKDGVGGTWVDPKDWISTTYPWTCNASGPTQLVNIATPEKKSKVMASPSLRLAFPPKENSGLEDRSSNRSKTNSLSSSSSKDTGETSQSSDTSPTSSESSDIYSVPFSQVKSDGTYDTLSIYRRPRIDPQVFSHCKMETFTPLSYRKDYKPTLSNLHSEVNATNGAMRS